MAKKDLIANIIREREFGQGGQRELERGHPRIWQDKQKYEQKMMEILEKVSYQMKK